MPDNTLNFTTRVDLSGLQAGMTQAAQTVQTSSQTMAQALNTAKVAAQNLAQAQQQLGAAASAGNQQAVAVIQQYQQAAQQAQAAVQQLAAAQQVQTQAATANAAANTSAAAATSQVGVSATIAANGGLRVLEGSVMGATRAAGSFLATTLGLGPILEAAFPVIGAVALGEVLIDVGGELGNVAFEAQEVGETLGGGMWDGIAALVQGVGWDIDELVKSEEQLIQKTAALQAQIATFTADSIKRTQGPKAGAEFLAGFDLSRDEQVQGKIREATKQLKDLESQAKETTEVYSAATGGLSAQPTRSALEAKTQIPEKQHRMKGLRSLIADANDQEQKLNAALRPLVEVKIRQEEDQRENELVAAHENSKRARGVADQALTESKNVEFRAFQALDQHRRKVTHQRELRAQSAQLFAVATA
jgi:hypothetical protein